MWGDGLAGIPRALVIRYETLREDTAGELARVLRFFGVAEPDPARVEIAVDYCAFENMQRLERERAMGVSWLRSKDASDPNSYKIREGKVGGHRAHLSAADLALIDDKLDREFRHFRPADLSPGRPGKGPS